MKRFLLLFFLAALFASTPARAQWATFDAANAAALARQFIQIRNQVRTIKRQYDTMKRNLERFESMGEWNADRWLYEVDRAQRSLGAMSYVLEDIDAQMGELYGTDLYKKDEYVQARRKQISQTLLTMRSAMNTMRSHHLQIQDGIAEIERLKDDNRAAEGNRQSLQVQTNAAIYQTETLQMLREQIATLTAISAVSASQRLSEKARAEETARASRRAVVESGRPPMKSRWADYEW